MGKSLREKGSLPPTSYTCLYSQTHFPSLTFSLMLLSHLSSLPYSSPPFSSFFSSPSPFPYFWSQALSLVFFQSLLSLSLSFFSFPLSLPPSLLLTSTLLPPVSSSITLLLPLPLVWAQAHTHFIFYTDCIFIYLFYV